MWGIDTRQWERPYRWYQNWFISFYWWCQTFNPDTWDFWITKGEYRSWGYSYDYYDGPIHAWGFWWFTINHCPWQQRKLPSKWSWTEIEIMKILEAGDDTSRS